MLSPTATFVGKKGSGFGAFYISDKTARAPQGTAGHHYLFLNTTYGLSENADLVLYHSRVLGRYEDEHLQMSGLLLKYRLSPNLASGVLMQLGNQRGVQGFMAVRLTLGSASKSKEGNPERERESALTLHLGVSWAHWKGEWEGEEIVPYIGVSWQITNGWLITAELVERQKNFLKPSWMVAVHRKLSGQWQLTTGFVQSGLSDRPYFSVGLGTGISIVR